MRPSALYMASDISDTPGTWQGGDQSRGGWLEVRYGGGGNVVGMVVRADCRDVSNQNRCYDGGDTDLAARKAQLLEGCECQSEQYYEYDWDEVNRLSEARRYDRTGGSGGWSLEVRQRYRYDASNQRMVKQTLDSDPATNDPMERVHLYVYPGRYERSGLVTSGDGATFGPYQGDEALGSETQYTVGGARMVWKNETDTGSVFDKDRRITYAVKDVIQSTSAVVDLVSGELLELTTFYPNGARETHRTQDEVSVQAELMGFTGKEADEEVGVVYFGERYLIPRIGRWASPDPLSVHAAGGGEVLNSYHYISGNLLQARDPIGLDAEDVFNEIVDPALQEIEKEVETLKTEAENKAGEYASQLGERLAQLAIDASEGVEEAQAELEELGVYLSETSDGSIMLSGSVTKSIEIESAGNLKWSASITAEVDGMVINRGSGEVMGSMGVSAALTGTVDVAGGVPVIAAIKRGVAAIGGDMTVVGLFGSGAINGSVNFHGGSDVGFELGVQAKAGVRGGVNFDIPGSEARAFVAYEAGAFAGASAELRTHLEKSNGYGVVGIYGKVEGGLRVMGLDMALAIERSASISTGGDADRATPTISRPASF